MFIRRRETVTRLHLDRRRATRESLGCEITGGDIKIGLNPDYLGHFLDAVETDKVLLELKDENSQCVGSPQAEEGKGVAGERYLCVIMPMRI